MNKFEQPHNSNEEESVGPTDIEKILEGEKKDPRIEDAELMASKLGEVFEGKLPPGKITTMLSIELRKIFDEQPTQAANQSSGNIRTCKKYYRLKNRSFYQIISSCSRKRTIFLGNLRT